MQFGLALHPPSPLADRYIIERELGRGGMATVWLAQDAREKRPVAIKVLNRELAGVVGVGRFLREIQVTAALDHPSVVPVLDTGTWNTDGVEQPWYAMPFMEGGSLRARLTSERQLAIGDALSIALDLAEALQTAHAKGVVHRDIKPENILFSEGRPRIVDFGIAKALHDTGTERLTSTGVALGTPSYMSPEQVAGSDADGRTDQYALATVLYEMLAGEPPFTGMSPQAMVARRMAEPARSLRPLRSTVPEHVDHALLRALQRAPADRFPDIVSFASALKNAAPTTVRSRRQRNGRLLVVAAVVVLVALGAWRVSGWYRSSRNRPVSPEVLALNRRGIQGYQKRTPAGAADAFAAFTEAVRRDSAFAPAWVGLAKNYVWSYLRSFPLPSIARDSIPTLAATAAATAIGLDSNNAEAWLARAQVSRLIDPTNYEPVLQYMNRSIALDSSSAEAWDALAGYEQNRGYPDRAIAAWRRAVNIAPTYLQGLAFLALAHYWGRQYDSAAKWADSAVVLDGNYMFGRATAGQIAVERGRYEEAGSAFEAARRLSTGVEVSHADAFKALALARSGDMQAARSTMQRAESLAISFIPTQGNTAVYLAEGFAAMGEKGKALAWLRRYEVRRDLYFQMHLRCDPPFDPLADDPAFRALLTLPRPATGKAC
jgi:serine/threonine protein kinase